MKELVENFSFASDFWTVTLPILLMAVDILTGVVNAWAKQEIKSSTMRQGLARKFGELIVLVIGQIFFLGTHLPNYVVAGLSLYIVLMELISICENLNKLGVPIPKFVEKALIDVESKIEQKGSKKSEPSEKNGGNGDESKDA